MEAMVTVFDKDSADHLDRYGVHEPVSKDCYGVDESSADRDGTHLPTTCKGQALCTVAPSNVCRCPSVYSKRALVNSLYVKTSRAKDMVNIDITMDHMDVGIPVNEHGYVSIGAIVLSSGQCGTHAECNHFFDHLPIEVVPQFGVTDIGNYALKNSDGKHGIEECHLNHKYTNVEKGKKEYNFEFIGILKKQRRNALFNKSASLLLIVPLRYIIFYLLVSEKSE